jgi:uncharacterized membrane protein
MKIIELDDGFSLIILSCELAFLERIYGVFLIFITTGTIGCLFGFL